MNGAVVAAIVSGLVSLAGIGLNIGQQRRTNRETRRDADIRSLSQRNDNAATQLLAFINELQEALSSERKRVSELEANMDQVRTLYHQSLKENDALALADRAHRIRISELETRVEELERKRS